MALEKPKPTHSIPQDEWVSAISALKHIENTKAKTYVVAFFNGDVKVFNKKDHHEMLEGKQLHNDSIITDCLFLKNQSLKKKLLVSVSTHPHSELVVSELSRESNSMVVLARSKPEFNGLGFKNLTVQPLNNEFVCSSYQSQEQQE